MQAVQQEGSLRHPIDVFVLVLVRIYRDGIGDAVTRDRRFRAAGTAASLGEARERLARLEHRRTPRSSTSACRAGGRRTRAPRGVAIDPHRRARGPGRRGRHPLVGGPRRRRARLARGKDAGLEVEVEASRAAVEEEAARAKERPAAFKQAHSEWRQEMTALRELF